MGLADEARAMLEGVNYATRDPETGDDLYPGAFAHITADELVKVSVTIAATLRMSGIVANDDRSQKWE